MHIHVVIIEGLYFREVSECGRYALTYNDLGDAKIFDDIKVASNIAEIWGGEVKSYETN